MLSHGQKRLISIFCAIVSDSKCIILDECTEGLDKTNINILKSLIGEISKDRIIIIVSHDYEFVENVCDRVYYLNNHKLTEGNVELSVLENYKNLYEGGVDH